MSLKKYAQKSPVDTKKDETPSKAFLACRLISLDKNPGLRPIGVGEVLRRIAGKVVMKVMKKDIKKVVRSYAKVKRQDEKPLYMLCTKYLNPMK